MALVVLDEQLWGERHAALLRHKPDVESIVVRRGRGGGTAATEAELPPGSRPTKLTSLCRSRT
jgi:hypothetical protein